MHQNKGTFVKGEVYFKGIFLYFLSQTDNKYIYTQRKITSDVQKVIYFSLGPYLDKMIVTMATKTKSSYKSSILIIKNPIKKRVWPALFD